MIDKDLQSELKSHGYFGKLHSLESSGDLLEVRGIDREPLGQIDYNQIADILDSYYVDNWDDESRPIRGSTSFRFEVL